MATRASAGERQAPRGVSLSQSSGFVEKTALIQVTVSAADYPAGVYELGEIVFEATSNDHSVANSPAALPVALQVIQQYQIFLPLAVRR